MLNHLLVPVDGSAPALRAARLAASLAGPGARLTLFHAIDPASIVPFISGEDISADDLGPVLAQRRKEAETEARALLGEVRADLNREAELVLEVGRAADAVLDRLEAGPEDSCVVGSRGRGTLARALLGSVSDSVLRHANRPVLVARRDAVHRILVPTDGSAPALHAATTAGELARRLGVPLEFLFVAEFPIDTYLEQRAQVRAAFQREADAAFAAGRAAAGIPDAPGQLVFHEPVHAILAQSDRTGADLVVLGRRGRSPGRHLLLGSVSQRVALNADVSVLVVP